MCPLIRQGIIPPPVEWGRRAARDDPVSDKEVHLEDMFARMQECMAYGSTALIRVNSAEYAGLDIAPVIIAQKAPVPWDRSFATDGMFDVGDIMVWIHDLRQLRSEDGMTFEVSNSTVSHANQRAIPLAAFASTGTPMSSCMTQIEDEPTRWVLKFSAIKEARSNAVLMSLYPSKAFVGCAQTALESADEERAPMSIKGEFSVGTPVQRKLRAPIVYLPGGRRSRPAWSGSKIFHGRVVRQNADLSARRYSYQVVWSGGSPEEISLAGLSNVLDEGEVERFLLHTP